MPQALFALDGERFVPSDLTRGPWSPDAMHGGPVAALLARLAEGVTSPLPMHPARLTVELLRPVPIVPLTGVVRISRPGRKVQLVEASLAAGGSEVARATLLRIRRAEVAMPERVASGDTRPPEPGPEGSAVELPRRCDGEGSAFHASATEHRLAKGVWGEVGPATDWIRLLYPVVAGEIPSPLQRVAAVADFGNGISSALPYGEYLFINPDLTIYLLRLPVGEWICLDAATFPSREGAGIAESALYDVEGRIGRAVQSLLIDRL
jgi:hypothetical protein